MPDREADTTTAKTETPASQDDRICTMGEIASYYRISKEHRRKVIHKLAKQGYLDSRRGRAGGIVLSHDAASMRIGDVALAMEEDLLSIVFSCRDARSRRYWIAAAARPSPPSTK